MRALRIGLVLLALAGAGLALAYTFRHDLGLTDHLRGTPLDRTFQLVRARFRQQSHTLARCDTTEVQLERPVDVILIGVDTLRASHLGFHGYSRNVSPNIDALAGDSRAFLNARSVAPWTLPSFAAIFTGQHPGALGITGASNALPPGVPLLGEILCAAGYQTAGVVSHSFIGLDYGFARGFERWDESNAGGHTHVSSARVTDRAIEILTDAGDDPRPLLLLAHYFDPHYDYVHHDSHRFGDAESGDVASESDNIDELRELLASGEMDAASLGYLRDGYDSEIAFSDFHIGRLLDAIRETGRYENALIVLVGDHGEAFAERPDAWLGHTRTLYDEALRVPLLVKLPGRRMTGAVAHSVSTIDIPSTIFDVLGHPNPPASAARLRSLLRASRDRTSYSQTRRSAKRDAIVEGRWKLIRDQRANHSELYDLIADPGERKNLATERPATTQRLEAALDAWLKQMEQASQSRPESPAPTLSHQQQERLRSLGYGD